MIWIFLNITQPFIVGTNSASPYKTRRSMKDFCLRGDKNIRFDGFLRKSIIKISDFWAKSFYRDFRELYLY